MFTSQVLYAHICCCNQRTHKMCDVHTRWRKSVKFSKITSAVVCKQPEHTFDWSFFCDIFHTNRIRICSCSNLECELYTHWFFILLLDSGRIFHEFFRLFSNGFRINSTKTAIFYIWKMCSSWSRRCSLYKNKYISVNLIAKSCKVGLKRQYGHYDSITITNQQNLDRCRKSLVS